MRQTWVFSLSVSSTAEMYPPLLPYIVFHQTIKQEDKETWNTAKSITLVQKRYHLLLNRIMHPYFILICMMDLPLHVFVPYARIHIWTLSHRHKQSLLLPWRLLRSENRYSRGVLAGPQAMKVRIQVSPNRKVRLAITLRSCRNPFLLLEGLLTRILRICTSTTTNTQTLQTKTRVTKETTVT